MNTDESPLGEAANQDGNLKFVFLVLWMLKECESSSRYCVSQRSRDAVPTIADNANKEEGCIGEAEDSLQSVEMVLSDAAKQFTYLESKMEDLENCSQPKNVIIVGLPENPEKTQLRTDDVQQMLLVWLGLDAARPFSLERAHCALARPRSDQHTLFVLCTFKITNCLQHS